MRVVFWIAWSLGLWAGGIWALRQPQTWLTLANVSQRIRFVAMAAYHVTKAQELRRGLARIARRQAEVDEKPLPSGGDVVDAADRFLQEKHT